MEKSNEINVVLPLQTANSYPLSTFLLGHLSFIDLEPFLINVTFFCLSFIYGI